MLKSHIFRSVIENFIVAIAAYILGYYFTVYFDLGSAQVGALWAVISGVFVMSSKETLTVHSARLRIQASFIGCLIAGVYLYFFSFAILTFAICIAMGVLLCHVFRIPDHITSTSITISVVVIIYMIGDDIGPIENAVLRFAESTIGSLTALVVGLVFMYLFKLKNTQ